MNDAGGEVGVVLFFWRGRCVFSDKTECEAGICRKKLGFCGGGWDFFPTRRRFWGCFVGKKWRAFLVFRWILWIFSDKMMGLLCFCRKIWLFRDWENGNFPTNPGARGGFVGILTFWRLRGRQWSTCVAAHRRERTQ